MSASLVTDVEVIGTSSYTVRKLSYLSLEKAQEDKVLKAARKAAGIGPDIIRLWRENPAAPTAVPALPAAAGEASTAAPAEKPPITEEKLKELREARYEQYDKEHVITAGVKSLTDTDTNVTFVRDSKELKAHLADLDLAESDRLHRKILDMSLPPMTQELAEELTKNS